MVNLGLKAAICLAVLSFASPALAQEYGTFTDSRDGNTYKTVKIGGGTWLAEHMKYISENISCSVDSRHGASVKDNGCLYAYGDAQKVCPVGWHLPTRVEYARLLSNVGDGKEGAINLRHESWEGGKNESGFGALPSGYSESGSYVMFGSGAYFWTSTECDSDGINAFSFSVLPESVSAQKCNNQTTERLSVRCIKNFEEDSDVFGFTDPRDGNRYKTANIGGRIWITENMRYLDDKINYKPTKDIEKFAYLYNWEDAQRVCPSGWHLPSKAEFDSLYGMVGKGVKGSEKLRDTSWEGGKNTSGFGAKPAGYCDRHGCTPFETAAYFWSSTEKGALKAYGLYVDTNNVAVNSGSKDTHLSIRCVKGEANQEVTESIIARYEKKKKGFHAGRVALAIPGALVLTAGTGMLLATSLGDADLGVPGVTMMILGGAAIAGSIVFTVFEVKTKHRLEDLKKQHQMAVYPVIGKKSGSLNLALTF